MSDSTTLDEQGIGRAFGIAVRHWSHVDADDVREIIAAYLTEPPRWPTDESIQAYNSSSPRSHRQQLRAALCADPIIKAAINLRDGAEGYNVGIQDEEALIDAVNEAGL
jgi:hypothetical protein